MRQGKVGRKIDERGFDKTANSGDWFVGSLGLIDIFLIFDVFQNNVSNNS